MFLENVKMALGSLRANKLRSFLTMLGIIIGIGSVISIVSIGDSIRKMFSDLYKNYGVTQAAIMINPSMDWNDLRESDEFTMDDFNNFKRIFGSRLDYADNSPYESIDVKVGRNRLKVGLSGVEYNFTDFQPLKILNGRAFSEKDVSERKPVVMISENTALKLFGTENATGKHFRADFHGEVQDFSVIAVYRKDLSPIEKLLMGSQDKNGEAFVPWTILTGPADTFSMIRYYGKKNFTVEEMNSLNTDIKNYFSRVKNRKPEDWYISSVQDEMKQVDGVMGGLSAAIGGIAAISLLVGGIGIMNIMIVSVTERTREIGIRKALGATYRTIMTQFLIEAVIIGLIGGILGIALGISLVEVFKKFAEVPPVITLAPILISFTFSVGIGLFFGIYPANKAAKEDPIVALRYE